MSNEIKIGLLTIITLALMFWGYKFVEGQNILKKSKIYKVEYKNAEGLQAGTTIMRSGFQVGVVTAVYLNPENLKTVIVEMDLEYNLPIPKNTIAAITTTSVMGDKNIQLLFDKPCNGTNCAQSGDFLRPGSKSVLASMVGGAEEIKSYVDVMTEGVNKVIDSLGQSSVDENSALGKTMADVNIILQNLKNTTANLNALIAKNSGEINTIMKGLESRNEAIQRIIDNADVLTQKLAKLELDATLSNADGAISNLNTTLLSANSTVKELKDIMAEINQGNGTLGQLIKDDALHNRLEKTLTNMDLLLQDVRLNPARYTTFLKKKRPKYDTPENDPASGN